jgi:chemotaxis signal transduction protein
LLSRLDRGRSGRAAARPGMLAFVLGGRTCALSLGLVAGVAEIGVITRLPAANPRHLGVIVHRGAVLPLLALDRQLDGAPMPGGMGQPAFCIITRSEPVIAFPVEAVLGLRPLPADVPAAGSPWEILDRLILDLAHDQDPAD